MPGRRTAVGHRARWGTFARFGKLDAECLLRAGQRARVIEGGARGDGVRAAGEAHERGVALQRTVIQPPRDLHLLHLTVISKKLAQVSFGRLKRHVGHHQTGLHLLTESLGKLDNERLA